MKNTEAQTDALYRLSRAIQIPTVSAQDYDETDFSAFDAFLSFLTDSYPLFHKTCEAERVNKYGLIYRWRGKNTGLEPVMLTAHYDVVPAGDPGAWKFPPFSGEIAEGRIWGRGTLDIKSQLIAHMEAAETLIRQGFSPERDIYFVYGQDEETGNDAGATAIAKLFEQRGLHFEGLLDEGGIIVSGAIKGVKSPVALIGVGEKGRTDFEITVKGSGGHSSMPPETTALGQIAELITRIEKKPLPARLIPPVTAMLKNISGEMGGPARIAIHNSWLFGGLLKKLLARNPQTNAIIRTTFAATMARGSEAPNVLPQNASVTVNVRLLSGDTIESVTEYLKKLAGSIPISIKTSIRAEASPISPHSGLFYDRIREITHELFPEAIITPYLVAGGTDSRKYTSVCDHIYRFTPVHVTNEEEHTIHNANESISKENYFRMINFFEYFIKSW